MTADIRTAAQREIRLDHLLGTFAVGSSDHSWTDEYTELTERWPGKMHILVTDIRANGIREPILLGSDGRVWNGHHRICAAMHIGLDTVPVEFCTPARVTPTREQLIERISGEYVAPSTDETTVVPVPLATSIADIVLDLIEDLAEGETGESSRP